MPAPSALAEHADWRVANQQALMREIAEVRAAIERHLAAEPASPAEEGRRGAESENDRRPRLVESGGPRGHRLGSVAGAPDPEPAGTLTARSGVLDVICSQFRLSSFERKIVLLCAGPELEGRFAAVLARAQGDPARPYPTFGLALAAFDDAHWSALTPSAPLRHWRLVCLTPALEAGTIVGVELRIDEWLLHVLAGTGELDQRLADLLARVESPAVPVETQRHVVDEIVGVWAHCQEDGRWAPVQLCGPAAGPKRAAFAAACEQLGWQAFAIDGGDLPVAAAERVELARLWEREALVSRAALLIDNAEPEDPARAAALGRFVDLLSTPVAVGSRGSTHIGRRGSVSINVAKPTRSEQRALWTAMLGEDAAAFTGELDAVVSQFDLDAGAISSAVATARSRPAGQASLGAGVGGRLWEGCRGAARSDLDKVAQRLQVRATFADLAVPETEFDLLNELIAQARNRERVYDEWGMAGPSQRGLGLTALFAGPSGTGKTLAAEVVAEGLRLDLYRIDLSQVVSKYIGETEKNLRRVFDGAEEGGAVLLFDEADALFGKRSEVRDSHDRYANVEVSYLLQRMESYRGVAILTTNMKGAIDSAFLRRLSFVVNFPFPDVASREQIWRRCFAGPVPTRGLDFAKLARLSVPGGNIRNIALSAAFLAANRPEPVQMTHLLRAAAAEYAKLERPVSDSEIAGWL